MKCTTCNEPARSLLNGKWYCDKDIFLIIALLEHTLEPLEVKVYEWNGKNTGRKDPKPDMVGSISNTQKLP